MFDPVTNESIIRLLVAGVLGAMIGLEREYRAKDAGLRTHFLVTLGSALIMLVSQWGFESCLDSAQVRIADPSRVAAQIVSGIGFIGAGTILMQKQFVRGLTTAAGLWVAAGIGMAVGGGLYTIAVIATIFAIAGLELFTILMKNVKTKGTLLIFTTKNRDDLIHVTNLLNEIGCRIVNCSVDSSHKNGVETLRVKMVLREHNFDENQLMLKLEKFPDVLLEKIE